MAEILISSMNIGDAIAVIAEHFPDVNVLKTGPTKAIVSGKVNDLDKIKIITNTFVYNSIKEELSIEIIKKEKEIQAIVGPECCRACESKACFGCSGGF